MRNSQHETDPTSGKRPWALPALLVLGSLGLAGACTSGPPPPAGAGQSLTARVVQHRAEKDEIFRSSPDSPIPAEQRASFRGLPYFPIDASYSVPARLTAEPTTPPVVIELATSRNTVDRLTRVGTLSFTLHGTNYTLTAFAPSAEALDRLFVPFGDLTNRTETYGGGRYLNLTRTATGLYEVDFNMAYHPYCVYDTKWVCPIPPPENRLPVDIRAGERMPS